MADEIDVSDGLTHNIVHDGILKVGHVRIAGVRVCMHERKIVAMDIVSLSVTCLCRALVAQLRDLCTGKIKEMF